MGNGGNFFELLTPFHNTVDSFDARYYAPAPPDWLLVVTDVESSTRAVEAGRHQFVNLAGAGPKIHAVSKPLHVGRSTNVWQTRLTNADGRLVAVVTQTQMVLHPRPAAPAHPAGGKKK